MHLRVQKNIWQFVTRERIPWNVILEERERERDGERKREKERERERVGEKQACNCIHMARQWHGWQ